MKIDKFVDFNGCEELVISSSLTYYIQQDEILEEKR